MRVLKKRVYLIIALYIALSGISSAKAENILVPETLSEAAILIDAASGTVLYEKNADERLFPASVTKVMTALILLERTTDFNERVYFSHEAVYSLPYNSSNIAMNEEETLTIDECMLAMMLESANEVSNAVAEHIGGSIEGFAKIMNDRAKALGALNTHFVNPHGLHDESHYTTARDMALIFREAAKNEDFLKYIGTVASFIPPTEKQEQNRPLNNSNKLIAPGNRYYNEYVLGGKTGFTDEAMHTLVSVAEKDGVRLISAVMKGQKYEPYIDANALFEYGFRPEVIATIPPVENDSEQTQNEKDSASENAAERLLISETKIGSTETIGTSENPENLKIEESVKEESVFKKYSAYIVGGIIFLLLALIALASFLVFYLISKSRAEKKRREIERSMRERFGRAARRSYKYKY